MKVTVIATGFPEINGGPSSRPTVYSTPVEREEESVRGRIFNSLTTPKVKEENVDLTAAPVVKTASPSPTETRPVAAADTDEDEDWGAVPAFLRRSKLK